MGETDVVRQLLLHCPLLKKIRKGTGWWDVQVQGSKLAQTLVFGYGLYNSGGEDAVQIAKTGNIPELFLSWKKPATINKQLSS